MLAVEVPDDGITFDAASIQVGPIRPEDEYGGLRVQLDAQLSGAKVRLQVDVGFGDAITPGPTEVEVPALLDFPPPRLKARLKAYPRETVVAEKLNAMADLGLANSRMKDFYDLAVLGEKFTFDGAVLVQAIRATFERRRTPLPHGRLVALTPAFATDTSKIQQWTAFVKRTGAADAGDLATTFAAVAAFLEGPLHAAAANTALTATWPPGGPWRTRR